MPFCRQCFLRYMSSVTVTRMSHAWIKYITSPITAEALKKSKEPWMKRNCSILRKMLHWRQPLWRYMVLPTKRIIFISFHIHWFSASDIAIGLQWLWSYTTGRWCTIWVVWWGSWHLRWARHFSIGPWWFDGLVMDNPQALCHHGLGSQCHARGVQGCSWEIDLQALECNISGGKETA